MRGQIPTWKKPPGHFAWWERDVRPKLELNWGWKVASWYSSGVVEIVDRRYRWTLRFLGVTDPRRPIDKIGSLTHAEAIMALRKIERAAGGGGEGPSGQPSDYDLYPTLWDHLSQTKYPDGSVRELSSLVIVGGGSEWRGCLSDKDNERVCWKAGVSLDELLLRLEEAASQEDPRDWRRSSTGKPKRKT